MFANCRYGIHKEGNEHDREDDIDIVVVRNCYDDGTDEVEKAELIP